MSDNYEWLSGKEHVLKRPDTYVGPVSVTTLQGHIFETEGDSVKCKTVSCDTSPALFKLFDEVIVNAIDNSKRDKTQRVIKATLDDMGVFTVSNDGTTIPIKYWEGTKRYIPEILVYELMSGENFKDEREKVGGRNGLGVKIVNLLSEEFEISIINVEDGLKYRQIFKNNAMVKSEPKVSKLSAKDKRSSTTISFKPDYARLGIALPLPEEVKQLIKTRVYDAAACTSSHVSVYFNNMKLDMKNMKDYALALGGTWIGRDEVLVNNEIVFEFCISAINKEMREAAKCVGFVNGLQCSSGTHVELVYRRLIDCIQDICKKKMKRACAIKPQQIRDSFHLVINAHFSNPSFSSQTKEKCDLRVEKFGFVYPAITSSLAKHLEKSSIVDDFVQAIAQQEEREVQKSVQQTKRQKHSIPKYQRALKSKANLYITEGDSAMAMALSGFSVIGRDSNGVFPLRGKLVNVFGMKAKTALEHKEIMHLTQILQLEPHKQYDESCVKGLPYRHIVIFTDQDHDGSHIMGLVLTFLREFFPSLLQVWPDFVQRFATHIVKAKIGNETKSFFSIQEYKKWCGDRQPSHVKYYKGLGTSTDEEAREYFRNIDQHLTQIEYTGKGSEEAISTFYAPDKADKRKDILQSIDVESCVDYEQPKTTFEEFCFNELIHHCAADNERSIPNGVDGLKPSQRKILHTARTRKAGEVKVASLAANTTDLTAYHHGEVSLVSAIMMMAQKHVGTNNIAYLKPNGQFGSRLTKRDEGLAAPRYVFTEESAISKLVFRSEDDDILTYAEDDGMKIEPVFFVPVIAAALVNGSEGIGTGYKTSIPNFNPRDIIQTTRAYIRNEAIEELTPHFVGFKGQTQKELDGNYMFFGTYDIKQSENKIIITELPPKVWSNNYFEWLQKNHPEYVVDMDQQSSKEDVCIIVKYKAGTDIASKDIFTEFKLFSKVSLSQMNLFDRSNTLVKYKSTTEIIKEHAVVRIETYRKRIDHQIEKAKVDVELYKNKARFLTEIVQRSLVLTNKTKNELREHLQQQLYYKHDNFDYLIDMKMYSLTTDEVEKMLRLAKEMQNQLDVLRKTTPQQVWLKELDELERGYDVYLEEMKQSLQPKKAKRKEIKKK